MESHVFDVSSADIIGACIEVHRHLGPGLLESTYEACLAFELKLRGLFLQLQCAIPVRYKGHELECGYRADFIVASRIVIELKSVDRLSPVHEAQLLTYMNCWACQWAFWSTSTCRSSNKVCVA